MSNKVNFVNGLTTGVFLGTPMQDAVPDKPEDNEAFATERNTQSRLDNYKDSWETQPTGAPSGGNSGGSGGGAITSLPEGYPSSEIGDMVDLDLKYEDCTSNNDRYGEHYFPHGFAGFVPIVGNEYTVTIDGVKFNTVARDYSDGYIGYIVYLGNDKYATYSGRPDNGEPFSISFPESTYNSPRIVFNTDVFGFEGFKSIVISHIDEIIEPLDGKFLPNGTPYSTLKTTVIDSVKGSGYDINRGWLKVSDTFDVENVTHITYISNTGTIMDTVPVIIEKDSQRNLYYINLDVRNPYAIGYYFADDQAGVNFNGGNTPYEQGVYVHTNSYNGTSYTGNEGEPLAVEFTYTAMNITGDVRKVAKECSPSYDLVIKGYRTIKLYDYQEEIDCYKWMLDQSSMPIDEVFELFVNRGYIRTVVTWSDGDDIYTSEPTIVNKVSSMQLDVYVPYYDNVTYKFETLHFYVYHYGGGDCSIETNKVSN